MIKSVLYSLLFCAFITTVHAQGDEVNIWKTLAQVTYVKEYDDFLGFKVDVPVFSETVKELAGTQVQIRGYIIPVEGYKNHKEFIFSAYPYNMCFFCGGAGPETVMEITAAEPVKYSAEPITLSGILMLNDEDVNRLMYGLTEARLIDR